MNIEELKNLNKEKTKSLLYMILLIIDLLSAMVCFSYVPEMPKIGFVFALLTILFYVEQCFGRGFYF